MLNFKIWLVRIRFSPWKSNCLLLLLQNSQLLFWNIHLFTHNANGSGSSFFGSFLLFLFVFQCHPGSVSWVTLSQVGQMLICSQMDENVEIKKDLVCVVLHCDPPGSLFVLFSVSVWIYPVLTAGTTCWADMCQVTSMLQTQLFHMCEYLWTLAVGLFFINPPLEDVLPQSVSH